MAAENYDKALPRVLVYEGGYVDDPHDPGGATNKGVTHLTYDTYRASHGLPLRPVAQATDAEIADIYRGMYWSLCRCDELPAGVDFAVFDAAVNSGPGAAGRWLQQALGADYRGQVDGLIGRGTVAAADAAKDEDLLVAGICARRMATLKTNKNWKRYGNGWSARVVNVVKIGQAWAAGSIGPNPVDVTSAGGHVRAPLSDTKKPLIAVQPAAIAAGVGSFGAGLSEFASAFDPIRDALGSSVHWLAAGLGLVGATGASMTALGHSQFVGLLSAQRGEAEVPDFDLSADLAFVSVAVPA
jgi:lysozyme family protein